MCCVGYSKVGGVSHDEHVAGEVTAVAAKLEQKEAELRKVSEK